MGYGVVARGFHWVTVLLLLIMIPAGLIMTQEIPKSIQDPLFILHKSLGPFVLLVVVARLIWRASHTPPPLPASVPEAQRLASALVHWGLYALLLAMAISGYVRVTAGGFPIESLNALGIPPLLAKNEPLAASAKAVHEACAWGLIALITLHVGAASFHGLVKRDGVFSRMWPPIP